MTDHLHCVQCVLIYLRLRLEPLRIPGWSSGRRIDVFFTDPQLAVKRLASSAASQPGCPLQVCWRSWGTVVTGGIACVLAGEKKLAVDRKIWYRLYANFQFLENKFNVWISITFDSEVHLTFCKHWKITLFMKNTNFEKKNIFIFIILSYRGKYDKGRCAFNLSATVQ